MMPAGAAAARSELAVTEVGSTVRDPIAMVSVSARVVGQGCSNMEASAMDACTLRRLRCTRARQLSKKVFALKW